jgi:hypothetical protein
VVPKARITARFPAWRMRGAGACVEGVFDPLAYDVVLAVDAVQVDLIKDAGAVPGSRGDLGGSPMAFSHRDRAACRRSYGRRASGVAASSGLSAAWRAACQARP